LVVIESFLIELVPRKVALRTPFSAASTRSWLTEISTEASWHNAEHTSVFTFWDGSVAPASLQTTARMLWDDQYLYIAFDAKDPDVYALTPPGFPPLGAG
jgi:hypothetical protein